jgi:hypothetical protein
MNDTNQSKQETEAPDPSGSENLPEPEDKVGPGRPPKQHQFKKGAPSPNPRGRPRKDATLAPDLKKALEDALNKKVPVKTGERQILVSKAIIGIEQLVNQFAKGDRHARRDLMDMAAKLGVDLLAGQKGRIEEALSISHAAILDGYFAGRHRPTLPPPERVTAPPELLEGIDMPAKTTRPVNRLWAKTAAPK